MGTGVLPDGQLRIDCLYADRLTIGDTLAFPIWTETYRLIGGWEPHKYESGHANEREGEQESHRLSPRRIPSRPTHFSLLNSAGLSPYARPAPSEHGRLGLHRLPAEEMMLAGPAVHLAATDVAFEATGVRLGVLLPCRGVVHAATGAGEFFDRPDAVGHCTEIVFCDLATKRRCEALHRRKPAVGNPVNRR